MRTLILPLAVTFSALTLTACSQSEDAPSEAANVHGESHGTSSEGAPPDRSAMNEAQLAYAEANDRMHRAMGNNIPADADVAFIQGMIPHHQGAIDMARIVLAHGKDAEARALAQSIITAQESEIAQMRRWLEKKGEAVAPPATDAPDPAAPVDHSKMGH